MFPSKRNNKNKKYHSRNSLFFSFEKLIRVETRELEHEKSRNKIL